MQVGRCPVCHSRIALEALVQDEAGRELLALLSKLDTLVGAALVGYLGLFRPASRDLANDRALRLGREVMELDTPVRLSKAMSETVESMRAKDDRKPLKNHNYLKRVLESLPPDVEVVRQIDDTAQATPIPTSKTGQALAALHEFGREE